MVLAETNLRFGRDIIPNRGKKFLYIEATLESPEKSDVVPVELLTHASLKQKLH